MTPRPRLTEVRVPLDGGDPFVSVVIPMRNEARHIGRCLDAVLAQTYPADRMEVVVVDGDSTDGSGEQVRTVATRDGRVRLVMNPRRTTPSSLNAGIAAARGEVIVRVDAHTTIAPDYVRRCVDALRRTGAQNVGGCMRPVGETPAGKAIAIATTSRFGVGNARFHYATEPGYVDTVYMGAWPRGVLDALGGFDERFVTNQDNELNFRILQSGGRIYLDPSIESRYVTRPSLRALARQYYRYGFGKARVLRKHGRLPSLRQVVAPILVASLGGALALAALRPALWPLSAVVGGSYALANLGVSTRLAARHGWRHLPRLPIVFATIHLVWGLGFLAGLALMARDRGFRLLGLPVADSLLGAAPPATGRGSPIAPPASPPRHGAGAGVESAAGSRMP